MKRSRTNHRIVGRRAVLAAGLILLAGHPAGSRSAPSGMDVLQQTGAAFAAIAEQAMPAVVFIKAEKTIEVARRGQPFGYNDPFGFFGDDFLRRFFHGYGHPAPRNPTRKHRQMGQGSGFLVTKDGYILTNHHVVGDADKITVKLHDGREFDARRVGTDAKSEVAVIKIEGDDFPRLEMGDSSAIRVGEWAVAIGNPFGLSATLTAGVISAKGRSGIGIADYEDFIQTDAAINPGNSGGPLLNIDGKVIGINTAIYSSSGGYMGIGFAIPINMAASIQAQLVAHGQVTRGYLGIQMQEITSDLAATFDLESTRGVLISHVMQDSPAARAGLQAGDIVVRLNGAPVDTVGAFRNEVASNPPGTTLRLTILRDGREQDLPVEIEALPDEEALAARVSEALEQAGLAVENLSTEMAQRFGYAMGEGVLVVEVDPGSLAAQAGIQPGNLITSVNRAPVPTVEEFRRALERATPRGTLLLRVRDPRYSRYIVLRLEKD